MFGPALVLFGGVVVLTCAAGFAIETAAGLDRATAFLAAVPGGIVDMSMISLEFGARPQFVAALQLERLILIMSIYPFILKRIMVKARRLPPLTSATDAASSETICDASETADGQLQSRTTAPACPPSRQGRRGVRLTVTLAVAAAVGFALYLAGVPAGALVGAMLGTAVLNILSGGRAYVAKPVKSAAQIAAGLLIGLTIDSRTLLDLQNLAWPALIILLECAAIGGVMGWILWKIMHVDLATALFGCAPAGLSDMVLIAVDEGGDPAQVMLLQLVRYIGVISLFPTLIRLICAY